MTTPYDKIADKFITTDEELDGLPIRRDAAQRQKEEERLRKESFEAQFLPRPGPKSVTRGPGRKGPLGPNLDQIIATPQPALPPERFKLAPELSEERTPAEQLAFDVLASEVGTISPQVPIEPFFRIPRRSPPFDSLRELPDLVKIVDLLPGLLSEGANLIGLGEENRLMRPLERPGEGFLQSVVERQRGRPGLIQFITGLATDIPFGGMGLATRGIRGLAGGGLRGAQRALKEAAQRSKTQVADQLGEIEADMAQHLKFLSVRRPGEEPGAGIAPLIQRGVEGVKAFLRDEGGSLQWYQGSRVPKEMIDSINSRNVELDALLGMRGIRGLARSQAYRRRGKARADLFIAAQIQSFGDELIDISKAVEGELANVAAELSARSTRYHAARKSLYPVPEAEGGWHSDQLDEYATSLDNFIEEFRLARAGGEIPTAPGVSVGRLDAPPSREALPDPTIPDADPVMPPALGKPKPAYSLGQYRHYNPKFDSDVDLSLYMVSSKNRQTRLSDLGQSDPQLDWLKAITGKSSLELLDEAQAVRFKMREVADQSDPGIIIIPKTNRLDFIAPGAVPGPGRGYSEVLRSEDDILRETTDVSTQMEWAEGADLRRLQLRAKSLDEELDEVRRAKMPGPERREVVDVLMGLDRILVNREAEMAPISEHIVRLRERMLAVGGDYPIMEPQIRSGQEGAISVHTAGWGPERMAKYGLVPAPDIYMPFATAYRPIGGFIEGGAQVQLPPPTAGVGRVAEGESAEDLRARLLAARSAGEPGQVPIPPPDAAEKARRARAADDFAQQGDVASPEAIASQEEAWKSINQGRGGSDDPPINAPTGPPTGTDEGPGLPEFSGSFDKILQIAIKPDVWRRISNLPILRHFQGGLNPAAVADDPAKQALVSRAVHTFEGKQLTQVALARVNAIGSQREVFGMTTPEGLLRGGPLRPLLPRGERLPAGLKGLTVNTIRSNPDKYARHTTPRMKEWIAAMQEVEKKKLVYLRANGIEIHELQFAEGGVYAGRRVWGKISRDNETLDIAHVEPLPLGTGPAAPGSLLAQEKKRIYATTQAAIEDGFRYLPEDEALFLNVQGAYSKVADKRMTDWFLTKVEWRTDVLPEGRVLAAAAAKLKMENADRLVVLIGRAKRGEPVHPLDINPIRDAFPEQANDLESLIPALQPQDSPAWTALEQEARRISLRAKANNTRIAREIKSEESALKGAGVTEGEIRKVPAFSGKILTGPGARKMAKFLDEQLDPDLRHLLTQYGPVRGAVYWNSVRRYFTLAGDLSGPGIQLLYLAGGDPVTYGKALNGMMRSVFDTRFQTSYLARPENSAIVEKYPGLLLTRGGQTDITEALGRGGFLRKKFLKVPVGMIAPFQRGFEGALDVAGIEMAKSLDHMAKTPQEMADLAQFINEFRGVTSSARLGVSANARMIESSVLLAPRYNRAIAALLFDTIRGGIRGKLARRKLGQGIMSLGIMAMAVSYANGDTWDEMVEHITPGNPKFFTWEASGQSIGPGGKIRSLIGLITRIWDKPESLELEEGWDWLTRNPLFKFARAQASPVITDGMDVLSGQDYMGDSTRDGFLNITENVVKRFMYIWLQSVAFEGGDFIDRMTRGASEFAGGRGYPIKSVWKMRAEWRSDFEPYNEISTDPDEREAKGQPMTMREQIAAKTKARIKYRQSHPDIDAKLFLTNKVTSLKSQKAKIEARALLEEHNFFAYDIDPEIVQEFKDELGEKYITDLQKQQQAAGAGRPKRPWKWDPGKRVDERVIPETQRALVKGAEPLDETIFLFAHDADNRRAWTDPALRRKMEARVRGEGRSNPLTKWEWERLEDLHKESVERGDDRSLMTWMQEELKKSGRGRPPGAVSPSRVKEYIEGPSFLDKIKDLVGAGAP